VSWRKIWTFTELAKHLVRTRPPVKRTLCRDDGEIALELSMELVMKPAIWHPGNLPLAFPEPLCYLGRPQLWRGLQ
jgi:hypothetical protein